MARVLLLLPTATYRSAEVLSAARRLGLAVTVAAEKKNVLESRFPENYLAIDFSDLTAARRTVLRFSKKYPLDAVLGLDDATVAAAAAISSALGLPSNPIKSVETSRNKLLMRERLKRAGVPIPAFRAFAISENPPSAASKVRYPCVLKPTTLSASQGVIRADNPRQFIEAWARIKRIVEAVGASPEILVEEFMPGPEVALDAILEDGRLRMLAIFDKPDPLDGPFFEETIYLRPTRLPQRSQDRIVSAATRALAALGLRTGPVHVELRIGGSQPKIIEAAARPIGGRCSRTLRFKGGAALEEVLLLQALGERPLDQDAYAVDPTPSGVMMIPIPGAGKLRKVLGVDRARRVAGVEDILISAHPGQELVPLPEGSRYLGFIFARAKTRREVEQALRRAHRFLKFELGPLSADVSLTASSGCG